jgi:hypothetical protein
MGVGEVEYVCDLCYGLWGGLDESNSEEEFKRLGVEEEREERVMMEA